ncbi:Thermostable beta-glucosidase B [Pseudomonas fluorescens]|uniref:Periplasmic beta-glucosidase n=2 Tax=Pseudomonas fluorescens TaxID=294 RepID=A0A5E7FNP3_PSEFL|nr:beta-glucosidase BglX [Pseudomonas fluorescens]VVO38743.1 Thermostable beta-glucosidase B [Pseudomonas fluorescens]
MVTVIGLVTLLLCQPGRAEAGSVPGDDKALFIADLLQRMTIEEKIGQLRLNCIGQQMPQETFLEEATQGQVGGLFYVTGRSDLRAFQDAALRSRLKIPLFFAYDVIHGHRTLFPIGLGLASTWDVDAVALSARIAAKEASADGLDMVFSPMVDITRDPRWGRMSEGLGEDTYMASRYAQVMVNALQGSKLGAVDSVMASAKHFALYGAAEGGRDYNSVDMSLPKMYQDYLPPYRSAVNAGVGAMMLTYVAINGTPATSNTWLIHDLLRKQWDFKGLTISDFDAVNELVTHGVARDGREAALRAIKAGVNMSMTDTLYRKELPGLLQSGEVSQEEIDDAVRAVLGAKYDLGLFADPYLRIGAAPEDPPDNNAEDRLHRAQAREVARKSLVLLKNRANVLPLKKDSVVAVVGALAKSRLDILGTWSSIGSPVQAVSVYDGIANALGDPSRLLYARGADITDDQSVLNYLNQPGANPSDVEIDPRPAQQMIEEAVKVAEQAEIVVAVVGESRGMSYEGASRASLGLPGYQSELIKALKATGKPLVLVLMNGRPLSVGKEQDAADAVLETWYSGTEGGNAIADVLFGDYNPSGKLPVSFPRSVGQIPMYYNHLNTSRPHLLENPRAVTSRYFDEAYGPLYPFGFGLSYTQFSLSDVTLTSKQLERSDTLGASVVVKNTGQREGETVVQLYVRDVSASISRPIKELKGFQKIMLKPGEEKVIQFTLNENDLKFYDAQLKHAAESGEFRVLIGLDSQNVKERSFELL